MITPKEWLNGPAGLVVVVIIAGLAFIVSGYAPNVVGLGPVSLSLGIAFLVTAFAAVVSLLSLRMFAVPRFAEISRQCKNTATARITNGITVTFSGLTDLSGAELLESSAENEVWIISPSLGLEQREFKSVLQSNLRKKVSYRYVLPDKQDMRITYSKLRKELQDGGYNVSLMDQRFVKDAEIFTDVGIYDQKTAVIWTPPVDQFQKYLDKYQKGFLVNDPEPVAYLVAFFTEVWRRGTP
ncbi:MAG: hypothetical protein HYX92_19690 [Chloroflexi bacterium]|nr:hypothetical protein [Chloroflexota bacterium]